MERDLPEIYPSLNVTLLDAIANANDALKPIRNATVSDFGSIGRHIEHLNKTFIP